MYLKIVAIYTVTYDEIATFPCEQFRLQPEHTVTGFEMRVFEVMLTQQPIRNFMVTGVLKYIFVATDTDFFGY
jgi:hypothetical protein